MYWIIGAIVLVAAVGVFLWWIMPGHEFFDGYDGF